jgi:multiple sugar transport system substrate-binding protein
MLAGGDTLAAAALAACGGQAANAPAPAAAAKATGKVVQAVAANSQEIAWRQSQADALNARHGPTLRVELLLVDPGSDGFDKKLQVMQASDTSPETFSHDAVRVPEMATNGRAKDLTPYIKRDRVDLADIYPALIRAWSWQGKQIAFNDTWDTAVLFVNRDLFKRAGQRLPDASTTYEQWTDPAKK